MSALADNSSSVQVAEGEETSGAARIAAETSEAAGRFFFCRNQGSPFVDARESEWSGVTKGICRKSNESYQAMNEQVHEGEEGNGEEDLMTRWKKSDDAAEFSEAVEQSLVYGGLLSEVAPPDMWQAGGSSSSDMWQGVSPQLGLCRRCRQSYTEATKELGTTVNWIEEFEQDLPTFKRWWTPFCPQERHNFFNVDKRKTRTNDVFYFTCDSPEQKDAWFRFCKTFERDHFKTPER